MHPRSVERAKSPRSKRARGQSTLPDEDAADGVAAAGRGRNVLVGRGASCNGVRLAAARHARDRAAGVGRRGAALLRGDRDARADGRPAVPRAHRAGVGGDAARAWGPRLDAAARERLAEAVVIADALGMVAVAARARALVAGEPVA